MQLQNAEQAQASLEQTDNGSEELVTKTEAEEDVEEIDDAEEDEADQQDDDDEEEEEVDDDEDAAVLAAASEGCEKEKIASTNGVHPVQTNLKRSLDNDDNLNDTLESTSAKKAKVDPIIADQVSSLVDSIVSQVDSSMIDSVKSEDDAEASEDTEETEEEELDDDEDSKLINGQRQHEEERLLRKPLLEAVKDLTDPADIKDCLIKKLEQVLQRSDQDSRTILSNPTETFTCIVAESSVDGEVRTSLVDKLVSTYLSMSNKTESKESTRKIELKIEDDETNSMTNDSFPPELVPQVDGVDSSAEGKSDQDQGSKQDDLTSNTSGDKTELMMDSNDDELAECDELMKTNNSNKTVSPGNKVSCDKSKILSEMENKFAKETQHALKNRPAYKRRNKSESWELTNGRKSESDNEDSQDSPRKMILMKEPGELEVAASINMDLESHNDENNPQSSMNPNSSNSSLKALRKFRKSSSRNPSCSSQHELNDHDSDNGGPPLITKNRTPPINVKQGSSSGAMSPPPLTPEVMPTPLRIDIPDQQYNHMHSLSSPMSSSSFTGSYTRRLMIRTPPAARAGLITMVSEAVLSKEDAEVAATAVFMSPRAPVIVPLGSLPGLKTSNDMNDHGPSLKIRLPKNGSGPSLVMTTGSSSSTVSPSLEQTPHHKKVPKRRNLQNLQNESDGGLDTEEEDHQNLSEFRKKKKLHQREQNSADEHDKLSADETENEGGKTSPDSQITSDDRQA